MKTFSILLLILVTHLCPIRYIFAQSEYPNGSYIGGPCDSIVLQGHFSAFTDSVHEVWVARYNGLGNAYDFASALAVDGSENVYVTGSSIGQGTGYDYATIKYDASGAEEWAARYNGPGSGSDIANAIAVDVSGNVYVAGYSEGQGTGYDYATIKYDASGAEEWAARYNGPGSGYDDAKAIAVGVSGNVYVTGYSDGDYATIKYDASGIEQWVASYNTNFSEEVTDLAIDDLGNVYVTGDTHLGYTTIKYDSSGTEQWVAHYNGPGASDHPNAIAVDGSRNVYVTGASGEEQSRDYLTVKYDASGIECWIARYNGPRNVDDFATDLALDDSGNVYVTGASDVADYATIMYDSSGAEHWVARYNGPGNSGDYGNSLAVDGWGNVYVTGYSTGLDAEVDYATIKYDASGQQEWVARYNGPGNNSDAAWALTIDGSGDVYVAGSSVGEGTGYDYATIKYRQTIADVGLEKGEVARIYSLSQNYPNPFNPKTDIGFRIADFGFVSLQIYDLLGREVATVVNEKLSPGIYTRQWDATGFASGVYLYRLQAGDFVQIKKLILLR